MTDGGATFAAKEIQPSGKTERFVYEHENFTHNTFDEPLAFAARCVRYRPDRYHAVESARQCSSTTTQ
jgi:hypothetical protein